MDLRQLRRSLHDRLPDLAHLVVNPALEGRSPQCEQDYDDQVEDEATRKRLVGGEPEIIDELRYKRTDKNERLRHIYADLRSQILQHRPAFAADRLREPSERGFRGIQNPIGYALKRRKPFERRLEYDARRLAFVGVDARERRQIQRGGQRDEIRYALEPNEVPDFLLGGRPPIRDLLRFVGIGPENRTCRVHDGVLRRQHDPRIAVRSRGDALEHALVDLRALHENRFDFVIAKVLNLARPVAEITGYPMPRVVDAAAQIFVGFHLVGCTGLRLELEAPILGLVHDPFEGNVGHRS